MLKTKVLFELSTNLDIPFDRVDCSELRRLFAEFLEQAIPRLYEYQLDQDDVIIERYATFTDESDESRLYWVVHLPFLDNRSDLTVALDAVRKQAGLDSFCSPTTRLIALKSQIHREIGVAKYGAQPENRDIEPID